jgi:hypothetical protein
MNAFSTPPTMDGSLKGCVPTESTIPTRARNTKYPRGFQRVTIAPRKPRTGTAKLISSKDTRWVYSTLEESHGPSRSLP